MSFLAFQMLKNVSRAGMSKVFARRATCGEMNICGAAFYDNTGRGPYSIRFINQAMWAGQNLIKDRIWPGGRTLGMTDLEEHFLGVEMHRVSCK